MHKNESKVQRRVTIIFDILPQYRVAFYEGLRQRLAEHQIQLCLLHGRRQGKASLRGDQTRLSWATPLSQWTVSLFGKEVTWLNFLPKLQKSDLVIAENAFRILSNYLLPLLRSLGCFRLAWWGMGRNLELDGSSWRNRLKSLYTCHCDHYFAYTEGTARYLRETGLDTGNITVVNNTINVESILASLKRTPVSLVEETKKMLGIGSGPVGIFCGGLYRKKGVRQLLAACEVIRKKIPDFEVIIIGDGEERAFVETFSQEHGWLHPVGSIFGDRKNPYFLMADCYLLPGWVGLNVIESFAYGVPLFTTSGAVFAPEIEYIENGVNGVVTDDDLNEYCNKVVFYLQHPDLLATISSNCRKTADKYLIGNMVNRFAAGILRVLNT